MSCVKSDCHTEARRLAIRLRRTRLHAEVSVALFLHVALSAMSWSVLIVEDDSECRDPLVAILNARGYLDVVATPLKIKVFVTVPLP